MCQRIFTRLDTNKLHFTVTRVFNRTRCAGCNTNRTARDKLMIMRNLLIRPWRFNELQKSIGIISQKVLVDNLRAMESDGLIIRTVFPAVPPHVEYSLSELGQSMRPILRAMEKWGTEYQKKRL